MNRGYTLIEVMVVVAIIAVLTSLAVTNFTERIPRQQLKEASLELVGQFRLARQKAISSGVEQIFSFPNSKEYNDPFLGIKTLPSHLRFSAENVTKNTYKEKKLPDDGISFENNRATFKSDGTVDQGAIYLTNSKNESVAITVNITGRVKKFLWNGQNWE